MAVTRDGIPVRVWSWPGNTTDTDLIRQVRGDIREWTLLRVIWVADRGFTSQKNRRALMQGGGGYIIGEKLRSGSAEVKAALSRQGRYATVKDNMQVKEVNIGTDDRFVLASTRPRPNATRSSARSSSRSSKTSSPAPTRSPPPNAQDRGLPRQQARAQAVPAHHARRAAARGQAEDQDRDEPGRQVPAALLRPRPAGEDIALGYKQLLEVERGWRDMKQVLDLRPVYHRREDRIRSHVLLCWLALLLIRVAETTAGPLDVEPDPRRGPAPARGHLHRPCRHLPPDDRAVQASARRPGRSGT